MVLADALAGIADEPHAPGVEVVQPAEPVEHLKRERVGVERVDREIAPCRVFHPVVREGDFGVAAVGGDIAAQRGDLDVAAVADGGDRAVLEPGGNAANPRGIEPGDRLGGFERGGDVDISCRKPQHRVAHRAADVAGVARSQRGDQLGQVGAPGPRGGGQRLRHRSAGTSRAAARGWR